MWDPSSMIIYFYIVMGLLAIWGISQAWLSQANTETIHPFKAFVHLRNWLTLPDELVLLVV